MTTIVKSKIKNASSLKLKKLKLIGGVGGANLNENKAEEEIINNLIQKLEKIVNNIDNNTVNIDDKSGISILKSINSLNLLGTFNKELYDVIDDSMGQSDLNQLIYSKIINGQDINNTKWPSNEQINNLKESLNLNNDSS